MRFGASRSQIGQFLCPARPITQKSLRWPLSVSVDLVAILSEPNDRDRKGVPNIGQLPRISCLIDKRLLGRTSGISEQRHADSIQITMGPQDQAWPSRRGLDAPCGDSVPSQSQGFIDRACRIAAQSAMQRTIFLYKFVCAKRNSIPPCSSGEFDPHDLDSGR
jgi:hypothetical protein